MSKIWILWFVFLFCASSSYAQQEEQYTLFMLNKLSYNPAYAGVDAPFTLNATIRQQWLGFEGAPATQKISSDFTLFHERVGMGFTLLRNTIGINQRIDLTGNYAYRFQIRNGYFGVGLNASIKYTNKDFRDKRLSSSTELSMDASIPMSLETQFSPNFGIGFYYKTNRFYGGASLPNMLNIKKVKIADDQIAIDRHHFYLMTGYNFKLNEFIILNPQTLLKITVDAPFDADFNLMTTFNDKLKVGLGYRLGGDLNDGYGESVDFLVGVPISKTLFFGVAYDMTLSELRKHSSGSIEGVIQYRMEKVSPVTSISPRFF